MEAAWAHEVPQAANSEGLSRTSHRLQLLALQTAWILTIILELHETRITVTFGCTYRIETRFRDKKLDLH